MAPLTRGRLTLADSAHRGRLSPRHQARSDPGPPGSDRCARTPTTLGSQPTTRRSRTPPPASAGSPTSTATRESLRYRGYPIDQLAEGSTYLDIAWLILNGELPTPAESASWRAEVRALQAVFDPLPRLLDGFARDGHPMAMFIALLSGLGAMHPDSKNVTDPESRAFHIRRLIAAAPTLAAMTYRRGKGLAPVPPDESLSLPANFLRMVFGEDAEIDPALERAMDVLFILHVDHEQNCSTSAMRGVGSSHADPYSSAAAASAALYGPAPRRRQRGRAEDAHRDRKP